MHDHPRGAQVERYNVTSQMLGVFRKRLETRQEFLSAIHLRGAVSVAATAATQGFTPRAAHHNISGNKIARGEAGTKHGTNYPLPAANGS